MSNFSKNAQVVILANAMADKYYNTVDVKVHNEIDNHINGQSKPFKAAFRKQLAARMAFRDAVAKRKASKLS